MKFFKKFIPVICLLTACIALFSFAGCNTLSDNESNCGGIVDNVEFNTFTEIIDNKPVTQTEVTITINENSDKEDFYYTSLFITQNTMDAYKCNTLNELVKNQNYIDDIANYKAYQSAEKSGVSSFTYSRNNHYLYLLIYESSGDFNDTLIPIADPSAYIGWIKF